MTEKEYKEVLAQNRLDLISGYLRNFPILIKKLSHYDLMSRYYRKERWRLVRLKYPSDTEYSMARNRRYDMRYYRLLAQSEVYFKENNYDRLFRELASEVFTMLMSCYQLELIAGVNLESLKYSKMFQSKFKGWYEYFIKKAVNPTK